MNNEPRRFRFGALEWALVGAIGLVAVLLLLPRGARLTPGSEPGAAPPAPTASDAPGTVAAAKPAVNTKPAAEWGIEVVGIYPAVGGRVLDMRYKILDPAKAAGLPNEPGVIYLVDEATGVRTMLPNSPRTGSIPQNPQKLEAGRTYSLSFPNAGNQFKSGSRLTLVMGAFRAEHLKVE